MERLTMTQMITDFYHPVSLTKHQISNIENTISNVVRNPNSAEGCAVREQLVDLLIDNQPLGGYYSKFCFLEQSACAFCDGWDAAMRLREIKG